jgi:1,4-dihydroxy-2-naphthoyl-CoA hydrolase
VREENGVAGAAGGTGATGETSSGGAAEHERQLLDAFNQGSADTLVGRMGIKIVEASARRAVATMPVAGNTQPYGLLHGGASCVLAETLGSLASALHAGPGRITVGIEINATHHRATSEGIVTAVATMVHGGSTLTTYDIVITDERGRRVCTARLSCLLRDALPGFALQPSALAAASGTTGGAPAVTDDPAAPLAGDV